VTERVPLRSGFLPDPVRPEHRIWWELHGTGGREVVCLLNGLAMHTKAWVPFLEDLDGYDVLLYDYLGQGASSSPDEPVAIPQLAGELAAILDELAVERAHVLGVSYGGFVALDFARLFPRRLHTLTLSGVLLSRERTFELYQELSLRFYAGGRALFPLYTRYLYEKIFGERFLRSLEPAALEAMRQRFEERYIDRIHSLVRLTEAQNPFFAGLEERLDQYRAVPAPALILAGEQDRCIPLWAQAKLAGILPNSRYELLAEAGHVVYLERRDLFFPRLRRFLTGSPPHSPDPSPSPPGREGRSIGSPPHSPDPSPSLKGGEGRPRPEKGATTHSPPIVRKF
jgi:pimeloyl-ACP methyl ester carboxylesterase